MLSFLLDEQISPEIAKQINNKRPDIPIFTKSEEAPSRPSRVPELGSGNADLLKGGVSLTIHIWHDGHYLGVSDEIILKAAAEEGLTLITYDQKTIPLILSEWGQANISHAGVVFIDYRSIPPNNFGGLIKAIIWLWDTQSMGDWQNRIIYLQPET